MMERETPGLWLVATALAAACGGGSITPPPPPPPAGTPSEVCSAKPTTQLAVGQHVIVDPASTSGCLRLPAAGSTGAQYLVVLASTSGSRSTNGIQGPYVLKASSPAGASTAATEAPGAAPELGGEGHVTAASAFDAMLREKERQLVQDGALRAAPPLLPQPASVLVGDVKTFKVCSNLQCTAFGSVQATARFVGQHAAIFVDNTVPQSDPLQPADFAELGNTFDTYHYPIDTTSFGRESDLDQNGVVIILMTDAVNELTPDCSNGRVVGFFYGGDLLTGPNSNNAEMFYTLVPAPLSGNCDPISRSTAVNNLKSTLIHEFQHMISFNQHVLVRSGNSEETWLNEALSHYAEELGGRLIPDAECQVPPANTCRSLYTSGDIRNGYDYLKNAESHFLVFPTSSTGTLEERGAAWLFVRWVVDQFATDLPIGTDVTRPLVRTNLVGATNIQAVTGTTLATLVPQWLMALYLDDGPDLPVEPTGRLQYKSWGLRAIWTNPLNQAPSGPFNGFPLVPDLIGGSFSKGGTLKGGSGHHFLVIQPGNGPAIDMLAVKTTANELLDTPLQARLGVVRIH